MPRRGSTRLGRGRAPGHAECLVDLDRAAAKA